MAQTTLLPIIRQSSGLEGGGKPILMSFLMYPVPVILRWLGITFLRQSRQFKKRLLTFLSYILRIS